MKGERSHSIAQVLLDALGVASALRRSHLDSSTAMLYAFRWKREGWVKLGWGKDPMQRASDGWWESSHPTIEN